MSGVNNGYLSILSHKELSLNKNEPTSLIGLLAGRHVNAGRIYLQCPLNFDPFFRIDLLYVIF